MITVQDPDPLISLTHLVFRAKRTTRCAGCNRLIRPGDSIVCVYDRWRHAKQTCIDKYIEVVV
jgi:hypothetical protein